MGVVVRRYIDILTIIINFPTPLVLALFWQKHPYFFVHFKNVFSVLSIRKRIRSRNGDFLLRAARTETALLWRCYTLILLEISRRTRWWCLKCVIVYLARDIRPFLMYCINEKPRSSLLIESIDSMIVYRLYDTMIIQFYY